MMGDRLFHQVMFPMGESPASGSRCVMIFTAQSLASTTFIGTIPSQSIRIACSWSHGSH